MTEAAGPEPGQGPGDPGNTPHTKGGQPMGCPPLFCTRRLPLRPGAGEAGSRGVYFFFAR